MYLSILMLLLWYGFIFYLIFFFFLLIIFLLFFKLMFLYSIDKISIYKNLLKCVFSFLFFFFTAALSSTYFLFSNYFAPFFYYSNSFFFFENFQNFFNINVLVLNFNLLNIYCFPFMYIFILITILSIFFCLTYSTNEVILFTFYCVIILIFGYVLFFTNSLILFFFAYEMLLIPSFLILYKFAKTRRCIEAAYLMFFWTQFGALFLIFSFLYLFFVCGLSSFSHISNTNFSKFEINFLFLCWIIGFGVKLPIWPFYGWLPKAHVEASTNFSIFLSGVLVKFAFFGLLKCLLVLQTEPTFFFVYPFLTIGLVDAVFKLFYQIDLKKLVAYSTVVEMHWLTICIISGQSPLALASFCMLISHALLSTNSFFLVDAINRRFKTRLITEISGINFICPKLFLVILANSLVFLGFPGTIFFIAEFLFFSFFLDLFPLLALFLIVLLYLLGPTFFFRTWMNAMFGFSENVLKKAPLDLSKKEFLVYSGLIVLMFWLGLSWQSFIF
uniref:NADH-ubiquinone oxidoreductase chain 4 n=1 Tax=Laurentiella strenua TaxID=114681 RepID=A0A2I4PEQ8_9SPIT|nr:nad4 [Laurentiella strenua]